MNPGAPGFNPGYSPAYYGAQAAPGAVENGYDYHDPSEQVTAYYDPSVGDADLYYSQEQQWDDAVADHGALPTAEPGFFTPVASLPANFVGDPVSAMAFSDTHAAIHLASAAKPMGTGRYNDHKASMLVTQSTDDGSLYSSVAGHPQAPASVLTTIYDTIYGASILSSAPTTGRSAVPAHAFRPYYGASLPGVVAAATFDAKRAQCQMGIHTLLALPQGYIASVSPAGIRLHLHGGYQAMDRHVEGMICGAAHPNGQSTHLVVGGVSVNGTDQTGLKNAHSNKNHLLCLDIWQDMRTVASHDLNRTHKADGANAVAVTALATSQTNGSLLAGCSDGQLRMFDANLRPLANMKSHAGGVSAVAVSEDGTLIATTGFGTRAQRALGSPVYAFPDPIVMVYDIRYLGRGGMPHPFAGVRGGPRHLLFLPNTEGMDLNRLLVASGLGGGGMQIVEPFQDASDNPASFILPPLDRDAITAICMGEDQLALGTSAGMVLQYRLEGHRSSSSVGTVHAGVFVPSASSQNPSTTAPITSKKRPLVLPPLNPAPPALSLGPELLARGDPNAPLGINDKMKSIFSAYILSREPSVSAIDNTNSKRSTSFGDLASTPLVPPSRLQVSGQLLARADQTVDFLQTIAMSELEINLMDDHRPDQVAGRANKRAPLPNANKLMYTSKLFPFAYDESINRTKKLGKKSRRDTTLNNNSQDEIRIPQRYRLTLRQTQKSPASFNHGAYNETGCLPGWDYAATMPNAFVPPVLMLLYCIPEIRSLIVSSSTLTMDRLRDETSILPELGFVFTRIDNISRFAMMFPPTGNGSLTRVGAWSPTNFISSLSGLNEASHLQILDGSPAAVDLARRPEAFYRFLLYHVEKEILAGEQSTSQLDNIVGANFLSVNEFISGSDPPSQSSTRLLTIDLYYENFLGASRDTDNPPSFADVLYKTLFRETRLRAWSSGSKSYQTIVQSKIITSLPTILSLSCTCAGRDPDQGLCLWRTVADHGHFLPEWIEIELVESGAIIVRELTTNERTGEEVWREAKSTSMLSKATSAILGSLRSDNTVHRQRYRLDIVLSAVRDDLDSSNAEVENLIGDGHFAHHVVHARVSKRHDIQVMEEQCRTLETFIDSTSPSDMSLLSVSGNDEALRKRLDTAKVSLIDLRESPLNDEWIAINGFKVSKTSVEDARAFHVPFKEPSLVIFRAINDAEASPKLPVMDKSFVPVETMDTLSLSNGSRSPFYLNQSSLPSHDDLLAFDAEFVSVGDEESILTETGSKLIVREMRYAVARISVINCRTRAVILDDYVLPREPVVDYLTRFSGIVAKDLDPQYSPHHLISTRSAYLKLRCLMERGCIFIGHGLQMDFWTLNLTIPSNQIIDTVEIYHKPAQRYVSLRFLANFVLKRDMQQDVHDSVEDAMAAYQLYEIAVELKAKGEFETLLDELYEFGFKNDWKLGVDDGE